MEERTSLGYLPTTSVKTASSCKTLFPRESYQCQYSREVFSLCLCTNLASTTESEKSFEEFNDVMSGIEIEGGAISSELEFLKLV